jgi:hypothetical protein
MSRLISRDPAVSSSAYSTVTQPEAIISVLLSHLPLFCDWHDCNFLASSESYKTSHFVGWIVGWKIARICD